MKLYLDLDAVLNLILPGGEHTATVRDVLADVDGPFRVNAIHLLQVENGLFRALFQSAAEAATARRALQVWRQLWLENVLELDHPDFAQALARARVWNAHGKLQPPRWGLLLHPALARQTGATHFLSLHPGNRRLARAARLILLPAAF